MLVENTRGGYRFLRGIAPYSSGVIACDGYEIVHATLKDWTPWRDGFEVVAKHLSEVGRDRFALCGMELRSPEPYTMDGFVAFNQGYCAVLEEWGLMVDGMNPVARTNVAPVVDAPAEPVLHAFSYTVPCQAPDATLVVAGAGELASRDLVSTGIVRRGETTADAMQEKAAYVMSVMTRRLNGLNGTWDMVGTVDVYTAHAIDELARQVVLPAMGPAARHGICWYQTRPPIVEIEFEMDMRGVRREVRV